MHLNEADFEGLDLPMECENDDIDYQPPQSLDKEMEENMVPSHAPEPVASVPVQPIELPTPESYEKHDYLEDRAAKRKSASETVKKKMIKVESAGMEARYASRKTHSISTRSSRRGVRQASPAMTQELEVLEVHDDVQQSEHVDLDDNDNDQENDQEEADDATYNPVNDLIIAAQSQKRGPGRPKGSKSRIVRANRNPRRKIGKPKTLFPCEECDKAFSSMKKLKAHSFQHTGERPYM